MTEWRQFKLKDILEPDGYIRGPFGSSLRRGELKNEGIPVYEQEHAIKGIRKFRYYIDQNKFNELKRFCVKTGDIIISCSGTVGEVSVIKEEDPKGIISQALLILRADKNVAYQPFLKYFLMSPYGKSSITSRSDGSVQVNIAKRQVIENIDILLPPLPEQKAIAEVLSSLDDKIDLLTRQNKTLEDLAQAYFRKWFIEDASSEWEVGKLGDEFNITMGQSPKGETYNDLKIGLPFFQGKAEFGFRFPLEKQYCSEPIKIADKFDTLLSVRAPVGALNMALYKCCIGRGLAIPIHKKGYKHYTFYKMKSLQELFNTFDDDGTVFGSISREKFLSIDNVIPPEKLVCYFDNFAKYFDLKIYENTVQIRTLSKLRDTLLPKLISGEVRVNI
ncbi:MAG: restriction endonuclease subunit S [Thermanaerothrix sp.]|nr:restriction endonuclease subunit S [Thermanaerothrix sp.]